jgi:hypothetical protein
LDTPEETYAFWPLQAAIFEEVTDGVQALASPTLLDDDVNDTKSPFGRNVKHLCSRVMMSVVDVTQRNGTEDSSDGKSVRTAIKAVFGTHRPPPLRWKMDHAFYSAVPGPDALREVLVGCTAHIAIIHGERSTRVTRDDADALVQHVNAYASAKSVRAYAIPDASTRLMEDAPRDVCAMLFHAIARADIDLLASCDSRRPESLGIRPLDTFDTLEAALKALAPRAIPTLDVIDAALAAARADDECASDDENSTENAHRRTALIQNDPEYFGFIG